MRAENDKLRADVRALTDDVRKLRAGSSVRGADSTNSSAPPSSDPPRTRAQRRALARAEAKKHEKAPQPKRTQGAQPGHNGSHLERRAPTRHLEHRPIHCGCGADLSGVLGTARVLRQVLDVPEFRLCATDHVLVEVTCPACSEVSVGDFATAPGAPVSFGPNIRALSTWLLDRHGVPVDRVSGILSELCNSLVSAGSVLAWQVQLAGGIIPHARGYVSCDDYGSYDKFKTTWAGRLPCWAHWLRRLDRVAGLSGCRWAEELAQEMRELLHEVNTARAAGKTALTKARQRGARSRLRLLCTDGITACQPNDAEPEDLVAIRRKGLLLAKSIKDHPNALAFARDFRLPATNNTAEQALRYPKVILRAKAGWRSEEAVRHKLRVASCLETAARGGVDRLTAVKGALAGEPFIPALC